MKRTQAVKNKLIKLGVKPGKVKIYGHGEDEPAADNSTSEGRTQNRRAVMNLQSSKKK